MTVTYYQAGQFGWLRLTLDAEDRVIAAAFVDRPGAERAIPKTLAAALSAYVSQGTNLPQTLYRFPTDGTVWQQAIWRAIAAIPAGSTITYTELAKQAGRPQAARSAGTACGRNLLALFIPCHRVVRMSGEDFGYSWGKERKRALLRHEGVIAVKH